jgi:predicted ATPase/DNA-binding SARP family transcriptional activator
MLEISLLGGFDVRLNEQPVSLSAQPVQKLLSYLLLKREVGHRREFLADLLWPGSRESSARKNLRNALWQLQQVIGEEHLLVDRTSIAFNVFAPYCLDIAVLEDERAISDSESLAGVLSLYRGKLLPSLYDEWIQLERERLHALFERRMQVLLDQLVTKGQWIEVLSWAERWISLGGIPEPAFRSMMTAHAARGDMASVGATYRRCVQLLEKELAVPVSADTQSLFQRLLSGEPVNAEQLATVQIMSPPTGSSSISPARSLPAQTTAFVGREKELAEIRRLLLNDPGCRLLTLCGPGGIGKTRLALESAQHLQTAFRHGVYFVSLAPLVSPTYMVPAIAESMEIQIHPTIPPTQQLLDYLSEKELLLVMDNFEHLTDAAPLVAEILALAPSVKVLATSREHLHLQGEVIYAVPSMRFPDAIASAPAADLDVEAYESVKLFLQRARHSRPDLHFQPQELHSVAHICHLVQGMPLAVVLAAGWLEVLSPAEIATEMMQSLDFLESEIQDIPPRQRSVRAAFDSSWRLLPEPERLTFMKLSVFRGGFTRRAALAVAGASLRTLRMLTDKSFVSQKQGNRYDIHELLRQYGAEKLKIVGDLRQSCAAHSNYFLQAVQEHEIDLKGSRQLEALNEIESDLENVRAAWHWAMQQDNVDGINRAVEALCLFFDMRSRYQEGVDLFHLPDGYPPVASGEKQTATWARVKTRCRFLQTRLQIQEVDASLEQSLAFIEQEDDQAELAFCLYVCGDYEAYITRDIPAALRFLGQSYRHYRNLDDRFNMLRVLRTIGFCYGFDAETLPDHQRLNSEVVQLARQIGSKYDEAHALGNLGHGSIDLGHYALAEEYCREAIQVARQTGTRSWVAYATIGISLIRFLEGNIEAAYSTAQEGLSIASDANAKDIVAFALATHSLIAGVSGDYVRAYKLGKESKQTPSNSYFWSYAEWGLAIACYGLGDREAAWRHLRAAFHVLRTPARLIRLLPIAALLLAQAREREQAVELLSSVAHHPLNAAGWQAAWSPLAALPALLQSELGDVQYSLSWERGEVLDIEQRSGVLVTDPTG